LRGEKGNREGEREREIGRWRKSERNAASTDARGEGKVEESERQRTKRRRKSKRKRRRRRRRRTRWGRGTQRLVVSLSATTLDRPASPTALPATLRSSRSLLYPPHRATRELRTKINMNV